MLALLTAACLATASHAFQLPVIDLYAILKIEGGQVGQAVHNGNGSDDLGPFQINTAWGPAIGRYWRLSIPDALDRVWDDGCANAVIASAILRKVLNETRGDLPKAIGLYHSHTDVLAARYRDAVLEVERRFSRSGEAPRRAKAE
jgi:hypothetical protein